MITFFITAKPFCGYCSVIQRNAPRSWQLLHPDAEVILFRDEAGAAEAARVLRHPLEFGSKAAETATTILQGILSGENAGDGDQASVLGSVAGVDSAEDGCGGGCIGSRNGDSQNHDYGYHTAGNEGV
jgi:hypothetical protein